MTYVCLHALVCINAGLVWDEQDLTCHFCHGDMNHEETLDNTKNYEELEGFGGLEGCLVNEEK